MGDHRVRTAVPDKERRQGARGHRLQPPDQTHGLGRRRIVADRIDQKLGFGAAA